jgi:alpha-N-arabinofuranosidase
MNKLIVNADLDSGTISRHIYGHFSEHLGRCIYEGYWVGLDSPIPNTRGIRNDVVEALKKLRIPNLRWPGGCFADEYNWTDGIGPREQRPAMVNTHWGGVTENNHFGTHEFLDLCEQLGAEPYICGNVGSGTVRELQQWVEYVTFGGRSPMADLRRRNGREEPWKVRYWGIGNESWGCGGNMRPEHYADEYRRYAVYVRNFSEVPPYKIACGANAADYDWTEILMRRAGNYMNGLSLHYYTTPGPNWHDKYPATGGNEDDWLETMRQAYRMEELLQRHGSIMDRYDPNKRVGLIVDEWGTWWKAEPGSNPGFLYQQNTLRDALVAGLSLNILNSHCDRVQMANIAQTVNVLQAMILTDGEKMLLTPTYHVFDMYQVHQDATLLPVHLENNFIGSDKNLLPQLNVSASRDAQNRVHITLCNLSPNEDAELQIDLRGLDVSTITARILTHDRLDAHNTFEQLNTIAPSAFETGSLQDGKVLCELPAKSVVALQLS